MINLLTQIPDKRADEVVELIVRTNDVRIERIVSQGHTSPAEGWYDQAEDEWVMVLKGAGKILFEDGRELLLVAGDHLHIAAHQKHRVAWTDPGTETIWLAVFFPH
jgi:cupin 2 domain-containing protein